MLLNKQVSDTTVRSLLLWRRFRPNNPGIWRPPSCLRDGKEAVPMKMAGRVRMRGLAQCTIPQGTDTYLSRKSLTTRIGRRVRRRGCQRPRQQIKMRVSAGARQFLPGVHLGHCWVADNRTLLCTDYDASSWQIRGFPQFGRLARGNSSDNAGKEAAAERSWWNRSSSIHN